MRKLSKKVISIWTDGSSHNNGKFEGIGGYGAVLLYSPLPSDQEELYGEYAKGTKRVEIYKGLDGVTNQQMELMSLIEALKRIKNHEIPIHVFSDSAYLINCMTKKWWVNWQSNGWKNSKKEDVSNRELWEELLSLVNDNMLDITYHKVKGHSNIFYNELADRLADRGTQEIKELRLKNENKE